MEKEVFVPPFLFCFVIIYMGLKKDIEYKAKDCLESIVNKSFNVIGITFEKFNIIYEFGQKIIFQEKSREYWKIGKLYKFNKMPNYTNRIYWIENPYLYKDFSFVDYKLAMLNKEEEKYLSKKNLHEMKVLPSNKIFLVLDKCNFTFKVSMCRIMIDNEICVFVSPTEQSKFPWNYYEEVR